MPPSAVDAREQAILRDVAGVPKGRLTRAQRDLVRFLTAHPDATFDEVLAAVGPALFDAATEYADRVQDVLVAHGVAR